MRNDPSASVKAWVEGIAAGNRVAEGRLYQYLWDYFLPDLNAYLKRRGWTRNDAQDWFQDAFITLRKNIVLRKFEIESWRLRTDDKQVRAYVMKIVKNLMRNAIKKEKRFRESGYAGETLGEQVELIFLEENTLDILARMHLPCRELLQARYGRQLPVTHIGKLFGLDARAVHHQTDSCMKNLLNQLKSEFGEYTALERVQKLIAPALKQIDKSCRAVLEQFYLGNDKQSWEEIAAALGLKNEHAGRTKRYECIKELRRIIGELLLKQ